MTDCTHWYRSLRKHCVTGSLLLVVLAPFAEPQAPALHEPVFKRELLAGSWKVDWVRSTPGPSKRGPGDNYREYEDEGNGVMLHSMVIVDSAQHTHLLLASVKYDGEEYPTYSGASLGKRLFSGEPSASTVAFKIIDAYRLEWTDRTNGKVTAVGTVELATDGKMMTLTNRQFDAEGKQGPLRELVYEKQ